MSVFMGQLQIPLKEFLKICYKIAPEQIKPLMKIEHNYPSFDLQMKIAKKVEKMKKNRKLQEQS